MSAGCMYCSFATVFGCLEIAGVISVVSERTRA